MYKKFLVLFLVIGSISLGFLISEINFFDSSSVEKKFSTHESVRQEIDRQTFERTNVVEKTYSRDKEFEILLKGSRNKETQKEMFDLLEMNE